MSRIPADLALLTGKIVTVDSDESIQEAVAVKFGRIIAVGANEEIEPLVGDDTNVIDLEGRTVIPGLIDSHAHMAAVGASRTVNVDLSEEAGVRSIADIQARLAERAAGTPRGEWVTGYQEDDSKLAERRHPTRWELDEASKEHPIIISTVGGHFSIANSYAFEKAGVTRETPDPVGGRFDRDPETGEMTGGLHEVAIEVIRPGGPPEPTREQAYEGAKEILRECASVGITCVYDTVKRSQLRAILDLKNRCELPVRVRMDVHIDLFPELEKTGIYRGLGDDWVRICGLKFFFDGAISARTAAVTEEYLNKPGFYGVMATTREIATETIMEAYGAGYRISAHANGDRAIEMYLDIMEEAQKRFPREDPRNRDIHCTVITPELVERIRELGILPTIFGPYVYYHGDKLLPAFGEERLERMFAARSFLDAGVRIAAHSDHPCAPYPPMMAIHGLVNRTTRAGRPIGQSQRVSVMEALKLYTINAAYQSFDENRLGSIEVGKLADMVILGEDILAIPKERIIDIPVDMTIIGGKTVFKRVTDA
ncbi:MAG: amidohydrolase [Candidatus Bathyarchaeota archaeon]|nr:MAG: amidohydrolase [Candidatus Bathyarchaeota archaeon]